MSTDWRTHAACVGHPIEWWFPVNQIAARRAREICARCEVRDACLAVALTYPYNELHGIWASTGMHTRRILRRRLDIADQPLRTKDTP